MFNRALNSLNLCRNDLGDGSNTIAQAVLQHSALEVFCEIPVKQVREDSLTQLDLAFKDIGAHGAIVLSDLLKFSRALKSVDLRNNSIPDEAIQQLRAAAAGKSITLKL